MQAIRVLFVDDEVDFLETLNKRMTRRGVEVHTAMSGEEALDLLQGTAVDVVVMDVKMPGMGGIEALRRIKAAHPTLEVIMLTGHADMEVAVQGMQCGAFGYLMKPADINELLYKIEDACKKRLLAQQKAQKTGGRQ